MFAVISYKGKQYKVSEGKKYSVDSIDDPDAKEIVFSDVLLTSENDTVKVGTPTVEGATVTAEVLGAVRGEKVKGMKFRPKKRYQRRLGHKANYTSVLVKSIKL